MLAGGRQLRIVELDGATARRHRSQIQAAPHVPHQERGIEVLQRQLRLHPALAPDAEGHDDGPQLLPGLGQTVFDDAGLAGRFGLDHASLLQLLEALGQQGRRHPRHAPAQIVEARAAAQQLAQDQRRPARADDLRRHRDGAKLAVAIDLFHRSLPWRADEKMLRLGAVRG